MAKITITIEDMPEGLIVVADPSMQDLVAKAQSRQQLTLGEAVALAAWSAIASDCAAIGDALHGEAH